MVTLCVERISLVLMLSDLDVVKDTGVGRRQRLLLPFAWLRTAESICCPLADGWG